MILLKTTVNQQKEGEVWLEQYVIAVLRPVRKSSKVMTVISDPTMH